MNIQCIFPPKSCCTNTKRCDQILHLRGEIKQNICSKGREQLALTSIGHVKFFLFVNDRYHAEIKYRLIKNDKTTWTSTSKHA